MSYETDDYDGLVRDRDIDLDDFLEGNNDGHEVEDRLERRLYRAWANIGDQAE